MLFFKKQFAVTLMCVGAILSFSAYLALFSGLLNACDFLIQGARGCFAVGIFLFLIAHIDEAKKEILKKIEEKFPTTQTEEKQ